MHITLNGERRELPGEVTVSGLLDALEIEPRKIAVELNLEIVPRSAFDVTLISGGDRLEIVQFVGGG